MGLFEPSARLYQQALTQPAAERTNSNSQVGAVRWNARGALCAPPPRLSYVPRLPQPHQ